MVGVLFMKKTGVISSSLIVTSVSYLIGDDNSLDPEKNENANDAFVTKDLQAVDLNSNLKRKLKK